MTVNELIVVLDLLPADSQIVVQTKDAEFASLAVELVEDFVVIEVE